MCLYPKLILNRKYLPNKKNGGIPPKCPDERLRYVTAACGKCYECRKQKARGWLARMENEAKKILNDIEIAGKRLTLEQQQQLLDVVLGLGGLATRAASVKGGK